MSSRLRDIASSTLGYYGLVGASEIHICADVDGGAPASYWKDRALSSEITYHTSISTGLGLMTTARNDVMLLTPDNHTQAASITWNKNMTHLVGMYPPAMMNMRARIGHSANFDNLLNVTGFGNFFAGLYLMYGRGNAANLTCLQVTGNRNTFKHCHFAAPLNATEGDQATFKVIDFAETSGGDGLEHYFNHCTIGADTVAWTNGDMMKIAGTPRLVFEDCMFVMRADNNQVTFLDGTAGDGAGFILFKNCTGMNLGTTLTVALGATGWAAATDIIIHNSGFTGATDLIGAANEAKCIGIAQVGAAADDINVGLGIAFDHTA